MKQLFQDILNLDHIHGIMLLSPEGDCLFEEFPSPPSQGIPVEYEWRRLILALEGIREADLVFGKKRVYIRKSDPGYLLIVMGVSTPVALVRLNCDIVLPLLNHGGAGKQKGLKSFFRKGK